MTCRCWIKVLECYVMMPLLALGLGYAFKLSPEIIAGMVLVGSINGGQVDPVVTTYEKSPIRVS